MDNPSLIHPGAAPALRTRVPASNPHVLPESASLLLDVVRLSAALLVVAGHLTFPELNTGFPDHRGLGDYAVPVFFVLSGFVIRFVTRSREHTLRVFLIDRSSRMYSVILPAMLLTLLVSGLAFLLNPSLYLAHWGAVSDHVPARIALNLTFLSQSWGHNTVPLINAPFWSLSYECLYYIAFALFTFLAGWKRLFALLVWVLLAGPQILFLLPIWWLGCWTYDLYHHLRQAPAARILRVLTASYLSLGALLLALGHPTLLRLPIHLLERFSHLRNPLDQLGIPPMRATLSAFGTGVFAAIAMLLLLLLSDLFAIPRRNIWARRFRRVADGTFSIYLMHVPLLVLALFLGLLKPTHHALSIVVAAVICLLLILLAGPLDRIKQAMRQTFSRRLPARPSIHHRPAA